MIEKIKKKIGGLNILLQALLLGLFIVGLNNNVSIAYTWEDIEDWIDETAENIAYQTNPPTDDLSLWNIFYNNWYSSSRWRAVKYYIGDISNYASYTFMISCGSDRYLNIAFCNNLGTLSLSNGTITPQYNAQVKKFGFDSQNNNQGSQATTTWSGQSMNKTAKGTFWYNTMNINFSTYYFMGQNLMTWQDAVNSLGWQGIRDNSFYYQIRIGQNWVLDDVSFRLYYMVNDTKLYLTLPTYELWQTELDYENGKKAYSVYYQYNQDIPLETPIYQELYYRSLYISTSNGIKLIFDNSPNEPTIPPINENIGQITNPSGEVTGNVNLGGLQEYMVQIIEIMESGEQREEERFNFWKETYNALFTISSGDIEDLYEQINEEMENIDGEYSNLAEEMEILESLRDAEPTDFRITWDPVRYNGIVIIPSGDINFNQITQEWGLTQVHNTMQIIVTAALVFLMYKGIWRCITITLGIGTELYDDLNDENEIVESQHETWNYNTGQATISTTKRQGKKSITVVGKAPINRRRIE